MQSNRGNKTGNAPQTAVESTTNNSERLLNTKRTSKVDGDSDIVSNTSTELVARSVETDIWANFESAIQRKKPSAKRKRTGYASISQKVDDTPTCEASHKVRRPERTRHVTSMQDITTAKSLATRKYSENWLGGSASFKHTAPKAHRHFEEAPNQNEEDVRHDPNAKRQFLSGLEFTLDIIEQAKRDNNPRLRVYLADLVRETCNEEFVQKFRYSGLMKQFLNLLGAGGWDEIGQVLCVVILNQLLDFSGESFLFTSLCAIDTLVAMISNTRDIMNTIECHPSMSKDERQAASDVFEDVFANLLSNGYEISSSYVALKALVTIVSKPTSNKLIQLVHGKLSNHLITIQACLESSMSDEQALSSMSVTCLQRHHQYMMLLEFMCQDTTAVVSTKAVDKCVQLVATVLRSKDVSSEQVNAVVRGILKWLTVVTNTGSKLVESLAQETFVDLLVCTLVESNCTSLQLLCAGLIIGLAQDRQLCSYLIGSKQLDIIKGLAFNQTTAADIKDYANLLLGIFALSSKELAIDAFSTEEEQRIRMDLETFASNNTNHYAQLQMSRIISALAVE